jgi:hypothetical protein
MHFDTTNTPVMWLIAVFFAAKAYYYFTAAFHPERTELRWGNKGSMRHVQMSREARIVMGIMFSLFTGGILALRYASWLFGPMLFGVCIAMISGVVIRLRDSRRDSGSNK